MKVWAKFLLVHTAQLRLPGTIQGMIRAFLQSTIKKTEARSMLLVFVFCRFPMIHVYKLGSQNRRFSCGKTLPCRMTQRPGLGKCNQYPTHYWPASVRDKPSKRMEGAEIPLQLPAASFTLPPDIDRQLQPRHGVSWSAIGCGAQKCTGRPNSRGPLNGLLIFEVSPSSLLENNS